MEPTLVERLQRAASGRVSHRALQILLCICALASLAVALLAAPAFAESARSLYNKGRNAEARQSYEAAYEYCKAAYDKDPKNIRYRAEYERTRFYAAMVKVHRGQLLRNQGKNEEALAEFQNAQTIAPALDIAQQEIDATKRLMEGTPAPGQPQPQGAQAKPDLLNLAQGPVELGAISDQPITLKLTEDSKMIYETIGKLAGINVLFDPDYTSRRVKIELNNVSLQEALQIVAMESRTFWRPVTKNTIFVASDTQQKRKEIEENVVRTFYLSNISQPTDLQDVVNALRTVIELQRIQQLPSQNAIVIRGTPDQLALAEKLIGDIDKPKPEVVIDVAVMQVSRNKERDLAILPPTNVSVALTNQSFQNLGTTTTGTTGTTGTGTGTNQQQPGGQVTFNTFKHLTSVSYAVNIPAATAQLLFSDADSKIIQNPQIRSLDGAKGSLKIGQRIPVATGSFGIPTVGTGTGGFTGTVNTQFQYIDVGVNIDVTPKIHADNDVTLKVMIDISSRDTTVTIGGIDQPVIGQRKIEHEIRLREGEVNIMGGIFEDQEISAWSGIPGLGQIPLFRYLFASQKKTRDENEIVFVMVPRIVRHQDLTPLNTRAIDIGAGSSISLRRGPSTTATPVATPATQPAPSQPPPANPPATAPQTAQPNAALNPQQNPPAAIGEGGTNAQAT